MMAMGDGLPVLERIRRTLIALRMPRALEVLDHAVHQLERGEASALELIDTLLAEELSVRETSRIKTALRMGRLAAISTACRMPPANASSRCTAWPTRSASSRRIG